MSAVAVEEKLFMGYFVIGIIVFVFVEAISVIFGQSFGGGSGEIGMVVNAISVLCAIVVICTIIIVDTIKSMKN